MSLVKWEPFGESDRFFSEPFFSSVPALSRAMTLDLAVDVYEEKGAVVAKMSLPGMTAKDIDVAIEDTQLTISGHREEEKESKDKEYYSKEIRRGSFSRIVALPAVVEAEKAEARYEDGILTITMPAEEGAKQKAVKVEVKT